jgi:hypothetical protein
MLSHTHVVCVDAAPADAILAGCAPRDDARLAAGEGARQRVPAILVLPCSSSSSSIRNSLPNRFLSPTDARRLCQTADHPWPTNHSTHSPKSSAAWRLHSPQVCSSTCLTRNPSANTTARCLGRDWSALWTICVLTWLDVAHACDSLGQEGAAGDDEAACCCATLHQRHSARVVARSQHTCLQESQQQRSQTL